MGTTYSLYLYASSATEADAESAAVFEEIDRLEQLLSNYRESSELSRINREADSSEVTTDPETFEFLQTSLEWSALSNGAFDITVGKLMKAWGFFRASGHRPTQQELTQVSNEIGWEKVQLDPQRRTVRFLSPGIELDPGGIGKGYAIERSVAILRADNVQAALLSAGSSTIYALGAPPGTSGWKVRVPTLGDHQNTLSTVTLRDTSISTANCSEKNFIQNHHLYCHIMNPHTLQPVEGILQVSIIDPSATASDALSNVLFVSSARQRASILQHLPKDSAFIITGTRLTSRCKTIRWTGTRNGYCSSRMANKTH
ncbi:FAD:protein FMN transferase [Granulicella sp. dw_53]|uniref:FAD:protein FMN transferase n=1 Tax=Granulicella sp. dw_53 TaxID=2719792 RepID=UPI002102BC69|nr:FAD:protein FMN transferase [Granulicella sp. dw_53]